MGTSCLYTRVFSSAQILGWDEVLVAEREQTVMTCIKCLLWSAYKPRVFTRRAASNPYPEPVRLGLLSPFADGELGHRDVYPTVCLLSGGAEIGREAS